MRADGSLAVTRRWFSPGGLGLFLTCLLAWVALFQLLRLLLLVVNRDLASDSSWFDLGRSFAVGLRFDLALAAWLMLPLLALAAAAHLACGAAARSRVLCWSVALCGLAVTVLGVGEVEFYREFYTRYNSLALHYWSQPGTVLSMLWHGFPVIRYLLVACALLAGLMLVVRGAIRFWTPAENTRIGVRDTAAFALLITFLIVSARGGLQGSPLEWGDAIHSESAFANHLAQNGLWTLSKVVLEASRGDRAAPWPSPMSVAEADARASNLLGWAEKPIAAVPTGPRPNVVVIIMESFSARYVGACGSDDDFTPEFNRLAQQGILFDRCFSSGTHTHQANVAVLGGVPNLPRHEALMEDYSLGSQELPALPQLLKQRGYSTTYLYNGDFAWENMRGFFKLQGIDRFIGRDDFDTRGYFDQTWGVSDQVLFERANHEFARAREPFFASVLTLSNHAPFELPRPLPFPETTTEGSLNKRIDAIRYADWALGQFFEKARKEAYFKNTLFVLVGDHGFSVAPILTDLRLLRFHVPLLFYAPDLLGTQGRRISTVASQNDVIPTILGLLGQPSPWRHWGRNLLALPSSDPGMAYFKPSESSDEIGFARGDLLLVRSADGQFHGYRYSLGFPPRVDKLAIDQHHELQAMHRDAQAYVTAANAALVTRQAAASVPDIMTHQTSERFSRLTK